MAEFKTEVPLIQLNQVNKSYQLGKQSFKILKNISLNIYGGEFVTIMGPSGSGKSTLINILGFLDKDFEGDYRFQGQAVEQRTDRQVSQLRNSMVGFVFQDFNLIESMTVAENVRLPLLYQGKPSYKVKKQVLAALDRVGIKEKAQAYPKELSGGQKQRVAIARALINQPKFIIADEPTGALDSKTSAVIMDILARLHQEEGVTIVMVTHDPNLQAYANRQIKIVDGEIEANYATEIEHQLADQPLIFQEVFNRETY
ncbi:ABC transporter ATP-binding protein [Eremococcus coleocola]|uniref:ABC transporter, ATP-binding protein n=1 Tax=Eremococcus coleocola ACS-139-V-Col8 TaxID=908337 RepID=E4KPC9_9LACT|nr:ABC transporter ATP-binding protein [Eremococcus coleocola]EFR31372.1 ABC transporter, ATP-binding protein [Eremococcus coleocola ACS-139-V-Col8]